MKCELLEDYTVQIISEAWVDVPYNLKYFKKLKNLKVLNDYDHEWNKMEGKLLVPVSFGKNWCPFN